VITWAFVVVGYCAAAALVRGGESREVVLFQNPSTAQDDPDSWTIQGILDDGIDGETGSDPFKLDAAAADREARRKVRLGLRQVGAQRTQMLLGGDDWLGAPFAVPEDVREDGEQSIAEDVSFWNTHSGQIGTGSGGSQYPYARARRSQLALSAAEANAQVLFQPAATLVLRPRRVHKRKFAWHPRVLCAALTPSLARNWLAACRTRAQMDDMFDGIATSEEVNRYAERGIDIRGAAQSHRAGYSGDGEADSWSQ